MLASHPESVSFDQILHVALALGKQFCDLAGFHMFTANVGCFHFCTSVYVI